MRTDESHQNQVKLDSGGVFKSKTGWIIALFLLLVLTAIIYSNSIRNEILIWDDNLYVNDLPENKDLSLKGLYQIFTSIHTEMYNPLTVLSFSIDYKLWGMNASAYHLENLVWHLLNILLTFYLVLLLSGRFRTSFICALFFAIHPMHVESVSWVAERKDLLTSFFYLGSLVAYLLYLKKLLAYRYLVFSVFLFLLALFAKPQAVFLPAMLFLFDYYVSRKWTKRIVAEKVPFLLLSAVFILIGFLAQKGIGIVSLIDYGYTLWDRLFLAAYGLVFYLYKLFAPFQLLALYTFPVKENGLLPLEFYLAPFVLLALAFLIYRSGRFRKEAVLGAGFYVIALALVLQLFPFGPAVVAEHYSYVSYIGLFYIIGQLVSWIFEGKIKVPQVSKPLITAVLVIYSIFFCIKSYQRNEVYKTSETFFTDIIEKNPDTPPVVFNNRGWYRHTEGDHQGAISDFTRILETHPQYIWAYHNRAIVQQALKNFKAAIDDYQMTFVLDPNYHIGYYHLGLLYAELALWDDAIAAYEQALAIAPDYPEAAHSLIEAREKKKKSEPLSDVNTLANQTWILWEKGRFEECIAVCRDAIDRGVDDATLYNNLSAAYIEVGDYSRAVRAAKKALELYPDFELAKNNLERARATR